MGKDWLAAVADNNKRATTSMDINITQIVEELRRKWSTEVYEAEHLAHYYRGKLEGVEELLSKITVPKPRNGSDGDSKT